MSDNKRRGRVSSGKPAFVTRSDDEDTLWSVEEIVGENPAQYKVKRSGNDPETGKPWSESWVPKYDCTDDLVIRWEAKQPRDKDGAASGF
jgi:hypothetical protein